MSDAFYGLSIASFAVGALVVSLGAAVLIRQWGAPLVALVRTALTGISIMGVGLALAPMAFSAGMVAARAMDAITDVAQNDHVLRVQDAMGKSIINGLHATWSVGTVTGGAMAAAAIALSLSFGLHIAISAVRVIVISVLKVQNRRVQADLTKHLPGLAIAAACSAIAYGVSLALPLLSAMLVAIILGILVRNLGLIPEVGEPGLALAGRTVLRAGVVLLGLRLSIPQVLELGWGVVAVIMLTVVGTYVATLTVGRAMRLGHAVTVLTATGTAICGAAAVAAMSAVVRDQDESSTQEAAATAIASVTLFGTISLVAVPWLGQMVGLTPEQIGVWIGAAVHEVGQVVAGSGIAQTAQPDAAIGQMLVNTALVTKLGRVVLLAPLVAVIGALEAGRRSHQSAGEGAKAPIVPLFVLGFLLMVLIRSVTDLPTGLLSGVNTVATILFTMAMVAMGAGVRIKNLMATGTRALLMGGVAGVVSALFSLLGVYVGV